MTAKHIRNVFSISKYLFLIIDLIIRGEIQFMAGMKAPVNFKYYLTP